MAKAGFSHEDRGNTNVDWYTPPWMFQRIGLEFDLDPCQPPEGITWIPAKRRYSLEDDGLAQPWEGRVWLNPPYGKHTSAWLSRMHQHRNGIALVFARTNCAWFHDSVAKADAILFLHGRVRFVDGLAISGGSGAGSGSMLVAWGEENVKALESMKDLGHLVVAELEGHLLNAKDSIEEHLRKIAELEERLKIADDLIMRDYMILHGVVKDEEDVRTKTIEECSDMIERKYLTKQGDYAQSRRDAASKIRRMK